MLALIRMFRPHPGAEPVSTHKGITLTNPKESPPTDVRLHAAVKVDGSFNYLTARGKLMNSNWLKFVLAAFFSAAVFIAPGCGGGDDDDDDDSDESGDIGDNESNDQTPGVFSPVQG